jgi:pimeloyl-ACP methyl ester carboxylesterase
MTIGIGTYGINAEASGIRTCQSLFSVPSAAHVSPRPVAAPKKVRASAGEYIQAAAKHAQKFVLPRFLDPRSERNAEKTWRGVDAPALIEGLLVPGTRLIGHSLVGANEPGVVKTTSGSMVHLRADVNGIGTNIGVSINAVRDNFYRKPEERSYVRENSDAVIVFIHGGGTKTTGHHVAAQVMDYMANYNVDVIAMDLGWHGEGSRRSPKSIRDELTVVRDVTKHLIGKSNKPVFLVGHSMGGVISDLYMRNFPKDDLFAGVVPLSTVGDPVPGGTAAQKRARENEIDLVNRENPNIPEGERDLGAALARQNKISPSSGFYCDILMTGVEWKMPSHQGADYLPSLYIIGKGDGLYQGYETQFREGVAGLKKAQLVVYEPRRDIKAKDEERVQIGHLIFDHKPPVEFADSVSPEVRKKVLDGKVDKAEFERLRREGLVRIEDQFGYEDLKSPETFVRVRNFIAQVTGKELQRSPVVRDSLDDITQEYMKNIAFREFADRHVYQWMRATQEGASLGQEVSRLSKEFGALEGLVKRGEAKPADLARLEEVKASHATLIQIMKDKGVVSDANRPHFEAVKAELEAIRKQMSHSLDGLKSEQDQLKLSITQNRRQIDASESLVRSDLIDRVRREIDDAFELMMKEDGVVRDLSSRYLSESIGKDGEFAPGLFENMPKEMLAAYNRYAKASEAYQNVHGQFDGLLLSELAAGRARVEKVDGDVQANLQQVAHDLMAQTSRLKVVQLELEGLARTRAQLMNRQFDLSVEQAELVGSKYFYADYYTVAQVLSRPLSDIQSRGPDEAAAIRKEMNSVLQKLWADWNVTWGERPQGLSELEGLY